ncbi:2-oxo-4-hydroxy-4-carboxy-5-ureidoimidazoline decarboxylase [Agarilytica rhodophyticola]|uniref:2-oxo-4-hydroxy-4-carboxy-5-ureidoimidazoline decarboxylase n=1 Tax=Agarilytica rhodophyticola TaxID=1737490 RepID=UPI000B3479B0|nr:2-oxo-4-hydroxy-4-carboxy-5-ureidoimidazoline decarboxylase [Agarilytica rhodophyticola]
MAITNEILNIDEVNKLSVDDAYNMFFNCCHCQKWANLMVDARPFSSSQVLLEYATSSWSTASEEEILEAFLGHAKIGDLNALRDKYASAEQGQIKQTSDAVLQELKQLNDDYENKFGFIFIVCASGKPAEYMLDILRQRIQNSRSEELNNGAGEQNKITHIRLKKLLGIS